VGGQIKKAKVTMKKAMKKLSQSVFFLITTALFCISYAWAQGENRVQAPELGIPCVTKDKGYTVHFTAYQKAEAEKEEERKAGLEFQRFCHDLPVIGTTYITIDLVDHYTRSRPVALRIVEATAGEEPGTIVETRTLVEIPEKNYRTGLVETKINFDKRGLYAAILTIGGEDISIPVRVGIEKEVPLVRRMLTIVLGVLILIALGYAVYRFRISNTVKIKDKKEEKG
jgi:hypothetical protein